MLLPLLFFILLEAGLRLADYGGPQQLFIPVGAKSPDHLHANPAVSLRYFSPSDNLPRPHNDYFLKQKPANGFRIFMLGESMAAGWPYTENMAPSRIIAERLGDAFPERKVEVVNLAFSAISSYTLVDFVDEILEQSPDAVLIYAGHNEFYGALGVGASKSLGEQRWLIRTYLKLQRSKRFMLLKDITGALQQAGAASTQETLMQHMVGNREIPYGSPSYQRGAEKFDENMRDIIARFKRAGVSVVISELVSNLRDQVPFVSVAAAGAPRADELYHQARQLEQQGRFDEARATYTRAKDLDNLPFRAPAQFNEIIHRLGKEFEVPVVPMQRYFEAESPHALVGSNLMLEHLHPNSAGYFLMSEGFLDTMRDAGMIAAVWPASTMGREYRQQWGVTELDTALARIKIINLTDHRPFKPPEQSGVALRNYQPAGAIEQLALEVFLAKEDLFVAHRQLARRYEEQGNFDAALREYLAIIAIFPYEQQLYRDAAWSQLKANRPDAALPVIERSLRVKPTAESYKWLGQIALRHHDNGAAISYFEQALKLYGNRKNPQVVTLLAQTYEQSGQHDKARQTRELLFVTASPASQ